MDVGQWMVLSLSQFQIYAIIFLLGSITVASLSDLKYMKAQTEFLEVWLVAVIAVFAYDAYGVYIGGGWIPAVAKWIFILLISIASHRSVGLYFSLARGDVVACAALAGILSPLLALLFYIFLKILVIPMRPFLKMFGRKDAYPFMPVVLAGTLAILAFARWVVPVL